MKLFDANNSQLHAISHFGSASKSYVCMLVWKWILTCNIIATREHLQSTTSDTSQETFYSAKTKLTALMECQLDPSTIMLQYSAKTMGVVMFGN